MRATNELWIGINRTYFEQFALNVPASNTKLHFFLRRDGETPRWQLSTQLNGKPFYSSSSVHVSSSIQVITCPRKVIVSTPLTQYTIKGVSLSSIYRRHLDFSVRIKKVGHAHQFSGILGRTVSTKTPYLMRKKDSKDMKKELKMKMRELYTVPTLFPSIASILKSDKFVTPDIRVD